MDKKQVSKILEEIGLLLELKGESPFKSNAYYNAARVIHGVEEDLDSLVASGRIRELKGIGAALAKKLGELVRTGRLAYYEELARDVPPGVLEMTAIPGMGPKKVMTVWQRLGVTTVGELEYACVENRLVNLSGFGPKTQEKIVQGILQLKKRRGYHLLANVQAEAQAIAAGLREALGAAELAGDVRRRMEVVRSLDLVAGGGSPQTAAEALRALEGLSQVHLDGTRVTARSPSGLPLTVRVVPRLTPHVLLAATGNAQHLAALAARAERRGVPWRLDADDPAELRPVGETEADLYEALGLPHVEPELREGLDEIETAEAGRLRPLVRAEEVRGIFHNHTTYSDGAAGLEEMVDGARRLGYAYIGISDHSQSAIYANGLKEDRVREQHAAIDALRKRVTGIAILKGIEADILPDGAMDYPDDVLARFDFVIGSVHSRFNLPEEDQTARVVRALANPHVTMLGHPTGRLLLSREGYRIDMTRVLDAARQHGKVVEINANPHRLDLDWRLCRYAKSVGVKVSINPDAHAIEGLEDVPYGVDVARKGGLESSDVVNTLGREGIQSLLAR